MARCMMTNRKKESLVGLPRMAALAAAPSTAFWPHKSKREPKKAITKRRVSKRIKKRQAAVPSDRAIITHRRRGAIITRRRSRGGTAIIDRQRTGWSTAILTRRRRAARSRHGDRESQARLRGHVILEEEFRFDLKWDGSSRAAASPHLSLTNCANAGRQRITRSMTRSRNKKRLHSDSIMAQEILQEEAAVSVLVELRCSQKEGS